MKNDIFRNLDAERARAGLTVPDLAEKAGMATSTFYAKKAGKTEWKIAEMRSIQQILQHETGQTLPLDYLFKKN